MLREGSWLPRRIPVELEVGAIVAAPGEDWAAAIALRDEARTETQRLTRDQDLNAPGSAGGAP
jgi:hypothetical protein